MAHILIVEDEEKLARFVELELVHEGYEVTKCGDGREALELAKNNNYDLILLDIMLPGLNGLEVLRRINNPGSEHVAPPAPVILLTARDAVMDKVAGLDAGAVDYITKPFAIEELLARVRVALKLHRASESSSEDAPENSDQGSARSDAANGIYRWKSLVLDEKKHRVTYDGKEITLTNREFEMLKVFLTNQDIVLTRDTLLEKVCGYDYVGETNVVDVYVRFLRTKIDEVFDIKMIETVRGVGYVIKSE